MNIQEFIETLWWNCSMVEITVKLTVLFAMFILLPVFAALAILG